MIILKQKMNSKTLIKVFIAILFLTCTQAHAATGENRIVSLTPSLTELLCTIGFAAEIVGISDYCNYPTEVQNKTRIGGLELSIEKILSLRPSIIVDANNMHRKYEPLFKQLGLNYVNFTTTRLNHTPDTALALAGMLNAPEKGSDFTAKWNAQLDELDLKASDQRARVYFEIWDTPIQGAGGQSFISELIDQAGGTNILDTHGDYPVINHEMIIGADPDVILICYPSPDLDKIKNRPGWNVVKAVRQNHVYALDQDIFVRPGPRNLEAIALLKKIFQGVTDHAH